ncbi:MAG: histidine kinase N-terminal 7TM domain-containing protein, partial [Halococcoides sp.]
MNFVSTLAPLVIDGTRAAYLGVFVLAGLATLVSAVRAAWITDDETRRGLLALLLTSSGWAFAQAGYLATADPTIANVFYEIGLIIGLSAIGSWLYFCSAYTGRSLHRDPTLRAVAIVTFLGIVAIKLTNPLHGLYYSSRLVAIPFAHVSIQNSLLHWTVMGGSYALATVGYFMLFERFRHVSHNTRPLLALLLLTGLPIAFDIAAMIVPGLLALNYEPIGVAAFAVGLTFVYFERFRTIRLAGDRDDPVIILDADDRIQDFNRGAARLVPALADRSVLGEPFGEVAPHCAETIQQEDPIVTIHRDGETRYYRVRKQSFTAAQDATGRALVFTDETQRERYRNELERQNDRLEEFASMLSHDLRNPFNVAQGRLDLLAEECHSDHLVPIDDALDRMEGLIEDVLQMARQGQPVEETDRVSLGAVARDAWGMVETAEAELVVESDRNLVADPDRLQRLFENLFR